MMERQPEEEGGDRRSVPERLGSYLYYTRRDDGKGFPVYVRRPVEGTVDDERVVREDESGSAGRGDRGRGVLLILESWFVFCSLRTWCVWSIGLWLTSP